jgi:HAD superfamily hydrolase (TIGR01509 family)
MMKIGAIFDFDGVLFHSEREHELCWQQIAAVEGKPLSRDQFLRGFGVKNDLFIRDILKWTSDDREIARIIHEKESLFQQRLTTMPLRPIKGTVDLVERLVAAEIPCAIGSSSVRHNIDLVLAPYPHLATSFSVIISGEDVTRGKPDPDVFLKAAQGLKIVPEHCVVFEDAPLGIEAGKAAHMKVVGLTTTFPIEALRNAHPYLLVETLSEVSVNDLISLFRND